jgi:steroid delta-isomerase
MALPHDIDRFIRDYVRAFNARDLDRVVSLYAENATLEDPVDSAVVYGKSAVRAFYEQYKDQPS